jgi:cytochrome b561
MSQQRKQNSQNTVNAIVDSAIFLIFLVVEAPRFSGLTLHEWLGIAIGAGIIAHVLLHTQWIIEISKRFFGKAQWSARINYIVNLLLLIDIVMLIFTGVMISEVVVPFLGISLTQNDSWRSMHGVTANLFLILVALHVALHWQWYLNFVKRLVGAPASRPPTP